jgi:hypothetical protein
MSGAECQTGFEGDNDIARSNFGIIARWNDDQAFADANRFEFLFTPGFFFDYLFGHFRERIEVAYEANAEVDLAFPGFRSVVYLDVASNGHGRVRVGFFALIGVVAAGLLQGDTANAVPSEQAGQGFRVLSGSFDAQL